jgi:hypothetical protein
MKRAQIGDFNRFDTTSVANNGGSCQNLIMAGNWKSLAVTQTYIKESEIAMTKQANLTLKDKNY